MIERIGGGWRYRVVAAAAAAAVGRVVEAVDIVALLSVLTASVARSRRGGSLSLEWGCLRGENNNLQSGIRASPSSPAQNQKSQIKKAQEITKIFFLAISTSTEKFGSEFLS